MSSALKCTIAELKVLEVECNVTENDDFMMIYEGLNKEKWNVSKIYLPLTKIKKMFYMLHLLGLK